MARLLENGDLRLLESGGRRLFEDDSGIVEDVRVKNVNGVWVSIVGPPGPPGPGGGSRNVDGGRSDSVYLPSQNVNGGNSLG